MNGKLTCADVAERNLIERYVAGSATRADAEALEEHYLVCARCQEDLRLAAAIRSGLRDVPAGARRWWTWVGGTAAVVAAAALVGIVMMSGAPDGAGSAALGRVPQPPAYLGVPVRGPADAADSLFELGMTAYVEERYDEARIALAAALAAGVDSVPAEFFRATSHLLLGEPAAAAAGYARVSEQGDTPYRAEAHFYRAKALLQLERPREAVADLEAAQAAGGEIGGQAQALADSVRRWLER